MKSVAVLRNPGVVAEQIALGIRTKKTHPGGQSVFDVGIEKESGFARAAGGGDQSMDIVCIHQRFHPVFRSLAAQHQSLFLGEILPRLQASGVKGTKV